MSGNKNDSYAALLAAAVGAGIAVGGAAVAAYNWFTNNSTNDHNNSNSPQERIKRCPGCNFPLNSDNQSTNFLICGHGYHLDCLYKHSIDSLRKGSTVTCQDCSVVVHQSFIDLVIRSRCCVCEKQFESDRSIKLPCGHHLHESCFKSTLTVQLFQKKPSYICPYSLEKCKYTMSFEEAEKFKLNEE